jgi:hypothetical protein
MREGNTLAGTSKNSSCIASSIFDEIYKLSKLRNNKLGRCCGKEKKSDWFVDLGSPNRRRFMEHASLLPNPGVHVKSLFKCKVIYSFDSNSGKR